MLHLSETLLGQITLANIANEASIPFVSVAAPPEYRYCEQNESDGELEFCQPFASDSSAGAC